MPSLQTGSEGTLTLVSIGGLAAEGAGAGADTGPRAGAGPGAGA